MGQNIQAGFAVTGLWPLDMTCLRNHFQEFNESPAEVDSSLKVNAQIVAAKLLTTPELPEAQTSNKRQKSTVAEVLTPIEAKPGVVESSMCSCGFVCDDDAFCIFCPICSTWFHGVCVGVDALISEDSIFLCAACKRRML
jgi:hypothetical protein